MIIYGKVNRNGIEGQYNLKTGQFIPKCCTECSRLTETHFLNTQPAKICGACIFLPIHRGTCKRQIKDQLMMNFG